MTPTITIDLLGYKTVITQPINDKITYVRIRCWKSICTFKSFTLILN